MQPQMAARAGAELAGYRIESVLGRGGMGVVCLATELSLDRPVALKLIAPALAADRSFRARFEREARAAASLDHPHVTPVYAAGEHDGVLYIAMRYVDGTDLRSLLAAREPLEPARATRLAVQVLAALEAAHDRGLVHRDVKPANVLVSGEQPAEHAYLTDFGLAKRTAAGDELTAAGQLLGTLDYIAPEQVRGEPVDARADLYALGCVLFEALSGRVPYPRENDLAKLWAHVSDPTPALCEVAPQVPPALAEVVERAMAKRADERFGAAREMAEALEAAPVERPTAVAAIAPAAAGKRRRLPPALDRTIGREDDRRALVDLLRSHRLVTLTGPGGVGKTRLALDAARELEGELADGAWFVPLAALARPADAAGALARALDVTPLHGESGEAAVERFLGSRRALVVLDNLEHLLDAAPGLIATLTRCEGVTTLVTSREPLRLTGERLVALEPLPVPAAGELFRERAGGGDDEEAVDEICRRLDGLPLAIELAAARARLLGAGEVRARLDDALDSLGAGPRDAPARQRTLRATLEWSHRLLEPTEAAAFARCAVFAGGATVEAALSVTGASLDTLATLVDKQLLRRRAAPESARLVMLETVRTFAGERLSGEDALRTRDRHAHWFLELVAREERRLYTREEREALALLDAEVENVRSALGFLLEREPATALRLAGMLGRFWLIRARLDEGLDWLHAARAAAGVHAPAGARALALRSEVRLLDALGSAYDTGELRATAAACAAEALTFARESNDPTLIADALLGLCDLEVAGSLPHRRRRELAGEALAFARRGGDERLVGQALMEAALSLAPAEAAGELAEAERALRAIGSARTLLGLYNSAAYNAIKQGDPATALPLLGRAEPIVAELGDPRAGIFLSGNSGLAALFSRDHRRARDGFARQLRLCREQGLFSLADEGLAGVAAVAAARQEHETAGRLLGAAAAAGPIGDADVIERLDRGFFAAARSACGEGRWDELRAEGERLGAAGAIELALAAASAKL